MNEAQQFESAWWGSCARTFGEEAKQLTYAHLMGLVNEPQGGHWPVYDLHGRSVLDIGGGPVSMLLKTVNCGNRVVLDPCPYPDWVGRRYEQCAIERIPQEAETWRPGFRRFDEVWIYNCLQHVLSPERIIELARECGGLLRIFEWVEHGSNVGHPHELHAHELNEWIGGVGTVGVIDENGAQGMAYWGTFEL